MTSSIPRRTSTFMALLLGASSVILAPARPAAADDGGSFAVPELAPSTAITIDCADGEWPTGNGVLSLDLMTQLNPTDVGDGSIVVYHPPDLTDNERLYVYLELDDSTNEVQDSVTLMFDLPHDNGAPGADDRGIVVTRNGTAVTASGDISNPNTGAAIPAGQVCVNAAGAGGTWIVELEISPTDLALSGLNDVVGAAIRVTDQSDPLRTSAWPAGLVPNTTMSYANLVTRAPIDYVLVIDQSGSMGGDKWTSVNQAGDNLALILSEFKNPEIDTEFAAAGLDPDRIGVATFSSSIGGNAQAALPLQAIPAVPGTLVSDALPASPGGGTPMIDGVNESFDMFGGAGNLGDDPLRTKVVMLLTDGKHNVPSTTVNLTNPPFDYIPSSGCGTDSLVRVNTVAVGDDATVNVVPLDAIKDCYNGQGGTDINVYNTSGTTNFTGGQLTAQLTEFFITAIEPYYRWNFIGDSSGGAFNSFTLNADEGRLMLFAFWGNNADAGDLTVTDPAAAVQTGDSDTSLGYSWLVIDDPAAGDWTSFTAPNSPSLKIALVDLNLDARFGVDNEPHGMSSTIRLTAQLDQGGSPVLNADVRVDAEVPTEGFGTFSVLYQANCEPQAPELPSIDTLRDLVRIDVPGRDLRGGFRQNAPDPDPGAYQLVAGLLEECGRDGLTRDLDPGLQLFDDGTTGDAVADDGVYVREFDNTDIQGSHVFRFTARGTAPDGSAFQRSRQVSEYIDFTVDSGQSDTGDRVIDSGQVATFAEYWVLPRSATGEYLGVGRADVIDFTVNGGQAVSEVVDYGNGFYSQVIRYRTDGPKPDVTVLVQGVPIGEDSGNGGDVTIPRWLLLLLLILILILLLLLILCLLRRRRRR